MNSFRVLRRAFLIAAVSLVSSYALAHAQTATFEPAIGQPGKDVVWVPTPEALVDSMLDLAKVTPQDFLIDLGSGDGRTVIAAAKRGLKAHGIEYNPSMVALSKRNAADERVTDRATFATADLFESDFSQATVVTMFLLPTINVELRPKILNLRPGTRIVSNTFDMGEWRTDDTVTLQGCDRWCTALLWIVPAKVEGSWRSPQGDLTLEQQFQMVSGVLGSGSNAVPVTNGRLRGDEISFTAGAAQYNGRVTGDTIEARVVSGGSTSNWRATRVNSR
jgi:hypothetical protein